MASIPPPYSPYLAYPPTPVLPACPKCGQSDQVQPVPFVYTAGKIQLAPPAPPRTEAPWETWAIVTTAILSAMLLCSLYGTLTALPYQYLLPLTLFFGLPGVLAIAIFLLIVIASQLKRMRSQRIDARRKQAEWHKALERWQRLLYCHRDDGVFLPPDSAFESVAWMKSLLYK